ncbi:MAG: hypothetical protein ACR2KN_04050 [Geodermatophilaceae bacterium]
MIDGLANTISAAALVVAAVTAVLAYLQRRTPGVVTVAVLAVLAVAAAVVVQAVIALVQLIAGHHPQEIATFIGYLLFSMLVLPATLAWAKAEPGRWGNGVLAVGCLTVAVMIVRMGQLWDVVGG